MVSNKNNIVMKNEQRNKEKGTPGPIKLIKQGEGNPDKVLNHISDWCKNATKGREQL